MNGSSGPFPTTDCVGFAQLHSKKEDETFVLRGDAS